MKLRNITSVFFLTVYTIVLAHNFVPHHHHSIFIEDATHQHADGDHHHHHSISELSEIDHSHSQEAHVHCNFEDATIPSQKVSVSSVFLAATLFTIEFQPKEKQSFVDYYILPKLPEKHCRDVQLRGPPQFS